MAADASPDVAPDPAPDPDPDPTDPDPDPDPNTPDGTLLSLIPSDIQAGDGCNDGTISFGAVAAIDCTGVQGLAAGTYYYYLFASTSALDRGLLHLPRELQFPE